MLKKTITYEDLDGNSITEEFYFNLSKVEITKLELAQGEGGLSAHLKRIVASNDGAAIMSNFEEIIKQSYGLRGSDNKQFKKSPEISNTFMQTNAYEVLFMELVTNAEASSAFVRGIVPASLNDKIEDSDLLAENLQLPIESKSKDTFYSSQPVNKGIADMTLEELQEAIKRRTEKDSGKGPYSGSEQVR